jgi:hypothetical protein
MLNFSALSPYLALLGRGVLLTLEFTLFSTIVGFI